MGGIHLALLDMMLAHVAPCKCMLTIWNATLYLSTLACTGTKLIASSRSTEGSTCPDRVVDAAIIGSLDFDAAWA